ncbi:leucine-rich repeat-containing protein 7 [Elsinoe australis]|uniref:Leucine-rich repeat-containing protein 7 n=1 Tax=Elsinoe australis TaxID=40998 RepID=A0A4U7AZ66_9PEZI|nr:leucine-rich repeat-containing protein 7 [Elsinoe australis]
MPGTTQPWLADLPDEWIPQQPVQIDSTGRSNSIHSITSSKQHRGSQTPAGSVRKGLTQLNNSAQNARTGSVAVRECDKSGTVQSVDSVVRYDTVERQNSPKKKEATLTWKKRLVDGELGYGDQTDLFGPSGLENIFQSPTKPSSAAKIPSKLQHAENMPSSPPPWPPAMFKKQDTNLSFPSMSELSEQIDEVAAESSVKDISQDELELNDSQGSVSLEQNESQGSVQLGQHELPMRPQDESVYTDRKISGQTDIGNETFSPVYISKHTTLSGEIGYTPMDSETARMITKSSVNSHSTVQGPMHNSPPAQADESENIIENSIPQLELSLLPDNLPTGTPPIARLGSFVTTNRGGMSNYGSFKTRPLSPSPPDSRKPSVVMQSIETQDFAHEHNDTALAQDSTPPRTPHRDNVSTVPELPTPKSSKSPLKLFGAYDTFTNSKLLRRLSQLEDSGEKTQAEQAMQSSERSKHRYRSSDDLSSRSGDTTTERDNNARSKLSNFGEHDLDEYDFEANTSFPSQGSEQPANDNDSDGSPEPDALPPGARSPFMFHVDQCDDVPETFGVKRKLSDRSTAKSGRTTAPTSQHGTPHRKRDQNTDGSKRTRDSPIKAPTPKRQRTLHALDLEMDRLAIQDIPQQPQFEEMSSIPAVVICGENPESSFTAVTQQRPRNPTPNQQRLSDIEDATNDFLLSSPKLQAIRDKIEESSLPGSIKFVTQSKAVANEVAAFTLNVTRDNDVGERKRSITTQDFLDEAMHIMSLIRARGRPTSGLGSVEEDNEDSAILENDEEMPQLESVSSILRVSRPPSREGSASGWRPRFQPQQDTRVASQLRRFQEKDDIEIFDTTVHSLKLRGLAEEEEYPEFSEYREYPEHEDGSRADIRITGPLLQEHDDEEDQEAQVQSVQSNDSGEYSTGRTQGTSSSRKSDNVATLAPDAVAHLIPEEVGGMTFDRTQGKWVRVKQEKPRTVDRLSPYPQSNITSDDDPFGNIPDLTVDEMKEMVQVRSSQNSIQAKPNPDQERGHARFSSQDDTTFARPSTGYDKMHSALKSSVMRGPSALESSQHQVETRATSWSTEHGQKQRQAETLYEQSESSEVSEPFGLESTPSPKRPIQKAADLREFSNETASKWERPESEVEELPPRQPEQPHNRRVSFQAQSFRQRRFNLEIDQSEMSIVAELPDKRLMSMSFAVSRPMLKSDSQLAMPERDSSILSDLPDFTIAEHDQYPGPTEQILSATVARHGLEVEGDRYALAVQNLVKTLTDVKGDEPFWEDIKHLSLSKQGLGTLHGLEDFCTRLQQLDISGNSISQLEGAPLNIRWLDASHNSLTNLTAWDRLMNLQYLDVSHNEITSLDGLGCLVHLREIKASHNQIISLNGIVDMEGLLKLDVSHNEMHTADFSHCHWTQLESLDMSSNALTGVYGLDTLSELRHLSVSNNKLSQLRLTEDSALPSKIHDLSASNNRLQMLDLTSAPFLRYLDLDSNGIVSLLGLAGLKQLDTLSLRQQDLAELSPSVWDTVFSTAIHARSVHLSGNALPSDLTVLTTQNTVSHLELATCGLLSLPKDFGLHFPNLSHLNLNFNALKDIRSLLNIQHLHTLHLAGNRISRLRKCVETLAHFKGLKELDLRDNPVSLGFYPALGTVGHDTQLIKSAELRGEQKQKPTLAEVQKAKEARYLLPAMAMEKDEEHKRIMDEDTKLRRRVHEILIASGCAGMKRLDGVEMDRGRVMKRDKAWVRLKELGILKVKGGAA